MLLEHRLVNISTVNQVSNANLNRPGVIYCGRSSSQNKGCFNPIDLGLGNPFSHKNSQNCVRKVNSLDECLMSYRNWGSPKDVRIKEEIDEMSSTNANTLPFL